MTKLEKLKQSIGILEEKIEKAGKSKSKTKDAKITELNIWLKKVTRRARKLEPVDVNKRIETKQKVLDAVTKLHDNLTKMGKKPFDAYVHSFRKKIKSLNLQIKRLNKKVKKEE